MDLKIEDCYTIADIEEKHKKVLDKTKKFFDISSNENHSFEYYRCNRTKGNREDELEINLSKSKTIIFDEGFLLPNLNVHCGEKNINLVFTGPGFCTDKSIKIIGSGNASVFFIDCEFLNSAFLIDIQSSSCRLGPSNHLMMIDNSYKN